MKTKGTLLVHSNGAIQFHCEECNDLLIITPNVKEIESYEKNVARCKCVKTYTWYKLDEDDHLFKYDSYIKAPSSDSGVCKTTISCDNTSNQYDVSIDMNNCFVCICIRDMKKPLYIKKEKENGFYIQISNRCLAMIFFVTTIGWIFYSK